MLLREDRGRRQHQRLLAVARGLERRAQRHLGLAVADVAADQAVHRRARTPCRPWSARSPRAGRRSRGTGTRARTRAATRSPRRTRGRAALALRVEVDQLARHLRGGALGARLHVVPGLPAELGERRRVAVRAHVAAQLRSSWSVGTNTRSPSRYSTSQVVARDVRDRLRVEAGEAADAVVGVDHDVARTQLA